MTNLIFEILKSINRDYVIEDATHGCHVTNKLGNDIGDYLISLYIRYRLRLNYNT